MLEDVAAPLHVLLVAAIIELRIAVVRLNRLLK